MSEFETWFQEGIEKGWITGPFCLMHDVPPVEEVLDEEDLERYDAGGDPCLVMVILKNELPLVPEEQ